MKKTFNQVFSLLTEIITLFNARCSCEGIDITVIFKEKYDNMSSDSYHFSLIKSNTLGSKRFVGTYNEILVESIRHCYILCVQLIESIVEHSEEWYKDTPELQEKAVHLIYQTSKWGDEHFYENSIYGDKI